MVEHKRQHFVPSSYLEAWCDPNTPPGQTPYVWRFSKDGIEMSKKAPQKIFYETDMYTIVTKDGNRDLQLEKNLSKVESEFATLRAHKLQQRRRLTSHEHLVLCMFVAAMYSRTKVRAKHVSDQWKQALDLANRMQDALDKATPVKRKHMVEALSHPIPNEENSMTMDEVREIVEKPIQSTLSVNVVQLTTLLYEKSYLFLETTNEIGFITSDNPCAWFDPATYQNPRPFGAGGTISPTMEITLPLSPNQMLFIGGKLIASGIHVPIDIYNLNNLNKRTRLYSEKYFISNHSSLSPYWFL